MLGGQNDDEQFPDRLKEVEVKLATVIERSVEDRSLLIRSIDINNNNAGKMDLLLSTVKNIGDNAERREAAFDKRHDRFETMINEKVLVQDKRLDKVDSEFRNHNKRIQLVEEKWNVVRGIGIVFGLLWVVIAGYILFLIESVHH